MNIVEKIQKALSNHIKKQFGLKVLPEGSEFALNTDPEKAQFGDINSNIALILAKVIGQNPRQIAQKISETFTDKSIEKTEIAGPGFLNFFLTSDAYQDLAQEIFDKENNFFVPTLEKKHNYNIEFVSANPTGPLHIGHGRGGIIGDVLASVLKFSGHNVTKEFYINDAGAQIEKLGNSFKIRCLQAMGQKLEFPEDGYHGDYLKDLAQNCILQFGEKLKSEPDQFFTNYAYKNMLEKLKLTLKEYGINFDVWFSEKTLHEKGEIEKALKILNKNNFLYENDGALWFKSKEFGDDKDRVLKKTDGEYTYVAADTAYLVDKSDRKFDKLVMVLGQDHHSYLVRLEGLKNALGLNSCDLKIILYQLVTLKESGQSLRMSKRAGTMVALEDVIKVVGKDVARYFYLNRKADAHLDFDIDLAMKKTDENPVYYIQYAYVRTRSILEKAKEHKDFDNIKSENISELNESEKILIKKIISLKQLLATISNTYQTHLLSYYTFELAQEFHRYYNKNRAIDLDNIQTSCSRLALIQILKNTFELCLKLLGINAPEKM